VNDIIMIVDRKRWSVIGWKRVTWPATETHVLEFFDWM